MATVTTNDVVELTMFGEYYNQHVLNVFHYVYTGAGVTAPNYLAEMVGVASSFMAKVYAAAGSPLRDRLVTSYRLKTVRCQVVNPVRQFYGEIAPDLPGTIAQDGVPPNCQVTVSYQTDRARRGATGNKRFTGGPVVQLSGDSWFAAYIAQWVATAVNLGATLDGAAVPGTYRPTVWSRKRAGDRANLIGAIVNSGVRITYSRTKGVGI